MEGLVALLALAAFGLAVVAVGLAIRMERRGAEPTPGGSRIADLERRLSQTAKRLELLENDIDAHRADGPGDARPVANAIRRTGSTICHVGLVRFDAFDDTGGGQSFALALIDDEGDGVILTSLHSRQTTRVFVKDIRGGVSDAPLSGEEEQALGAAGLVG